METYKEKISRSQISTSNISTWYFDSFADGCGYIANTGLIFCIIDVNLINFFIIFVLLDK